MTNPPAQIHGIPVSPERVRVCLDSASFWVGELPRYADRQQRLADRWAIASGILSAITSLSIWPVFTEQPAAGAKLTVAAVALSAAICALVPRVKYAPASVGAFSYLGGNELRENVSPDKRKTRSTSCVTSSIAGRPMARAFHERERGLAP